MPQPLVWHASRCPDGLLPWYPITQQGDPCYPLPLDLVAAHKLARRLRRNMPAGDLIAVRPDSSSQPVWPDAMADHYDLPPYAG